MLIYHRNFGCIHGTFHFTNDTYSETLRHFFYQLNNAKLEMIDLINYILQGINTNNIFNIEDSELNGMFIKIKKNLKDVAVEMLGNVIKR